MDAPSEEPVIATKAAKTVCLGMLDGWEEAGDG